MPIGFLKARRAITVSPRNPLPVQVQNLPQPVAIDTLLIGEVFVTTTIRDLLNSTDAESPTLTQTAPYKRFILYLFTPSAATVTLTLKGRATDGSGVPLSTGWLTLFNTSISTTTNSWHRIVMQANYATKAATRWKVYRRIIGDMVGLWLVQALYFRGTVYVHPQGWFGASVSDPTGVVDTGSDLKVNPIVELLKAMREVQQVLSDYLKFGSPSEVMDLIEAVARVKRV